MEKRWLVSLLANEHTIGALLKFLEDTEVGNRKGAMKREVEWEQRNNQKGENKLSDETAKVRTQEGKTQKLQNE